MLFILLIAGFVFVLLVVISARNSMKEQRKLQETVARNLQEAAERKVRREEGRERRTTVQEWEKEFNVLDATQFFNPRRGGRLAKLDFEPHEYKAEIEQYANEAGMTIRGLSVSDKDGRLVKVKVHTDNLKARAYCDCIVEDPAGRIIGGWQLAHEEIPYEFIAASINIGYFYPDSLALPTTVPIGYRPVLPPGGWMTVVRYKLEGGGKEETFPEQYLEKHFEEILLRFPEKISFKKSVSQIHVPLAPRPRDEELKPVKSNSNQDAGATIKQRVEGMDNKSRRDTVENKSDPLLEMTASPSPVASLTNDVAIAVFGYFNDNRFNFTTVQAFGSMLLRRKELDGAVQAGEALSIEEQKERAILHFLLGSPTGRSDDEPIIKFHTLQLEDVKDVPAIGEFTFGEIAKHAASLDGMARLFDGIRSGIVSLQEAEQVIAELKKWEAIKHQTDLSKEEFFAKTLAVLTEPDKERPSNN